MNTVELSKTLSWLLRHGAREAGVSMDAAGWVPVPEVLRYLRISRAALEEVVATNNKSRLTLEGDRVRACQGHSTENMPVTVEALEASWQPYTDGGSLWHGTTVEATAPIAREGLYPQKRTHVHLAPSLESKVGKRSATPVMLEISTERLRDAGLGVWEAQNGVVLVRHVPVSCIVDLACTTRAAKQAEASLRARFGFRRS
ncbi:RNA 2'-phosphotransferase [Polyangium sp. y55x31]|uniref:RNA 2'-phosphotransferase n=1 Tax=Polyangium sp. y55x31 TaxID=3042688 RepID=UPI0024823F8C|nr:RNA 2'-phosphotransferase [Polyangium sp. y55x31]MDI1483829.1 RNA 2'-phosphotransferase [Polyangium sp. y55x31]